MQAKIDRNTQIDRVILILIDSKHDKLACFISKSEVNFYISERYYNIYIDIS